MKFYNESNIQTVKDIKTAEKFLKISRTMLKNISTEVLSDNKESSVGNRLADISMVLDSQTCRFTNIVSDYKSENYMPGTQLSIFDELQK